MVVQDDGILLHAFAKVAIIPGNARVSLKNFKNDLSIGRRACV